MHVSYRAELEDGVVAGVYLDSGNGSGGCRAGHGTRARTRSHGIPILNLTQSRSQMPKPNLSRTRSR